MEQLIEEEGDHMMDGMVVLEWCLVRREMISSKLKDARNEKSGRMRKITVEKLEVV